MQNLFIIAGAQRSGTTYLYKVLDRCPINMAKPLQPEPKFFCDPHLYELGKDYYLKTFFKVENGIQVHGEKTTSYMTDPDTPGRIHKMFPAAKLIFLLRNPIERAISNYWFSVQNRLETESFEYAVMHEPERTRDPFPGFINHPFAYLARGRYIIYLQRFLEYFDLEQILFIKTEALFHNSQAEVGKVYRFLDINPEFVPKALPDKVNQVERREDVLTPAIKSFLTEYFKEDNLELAKLTKFDLADWNY